MKRLLQTFVLMGVVAGFAGSVPPVSAAYDLTETFEDFRDSLSNVDTAIPTPSVKEQSFVDPSKVESLTTSLDTSLSSAWDSLNGWLESNIGISLSEIIRTLLNFIIWVFELIVKILQAVINILPL
jgi:hypothetical protein